MIKGSFFAGSIVADLLSLIVHTAAQSSGQKFAQSARPPRVPFLCDLVFDGSQIEWNEGKPTDNKPKEMFGGLRLEGNQQTELRSAAGNQRVHLIFQQVNPSPILHRGGLICPQIGRHPLMGVIGYRFQQRGFQTDFLSVMAFVCPCRPIGSTCNGHFAKRVTDT